MYFVFGFNFIFAIILKQYVTAIWIFWAILLYWELNKWKALNNLTFDALLKLAKNNTDLRLEIEEAHKIEMARRDEILNRQ